MPSIKVLAISPYPGMVPLLTETAKEYDGLELTISVGDSQKKDVEFSDEMKAFCLSFDEPVEASYVSLYIKSGYEGDRWNDNCISEVEIYE